MIVARHEVPGKRWRAPLPGGTAEVVVNLRDICRRNEVHATLETLSVEPKLRCGQPSRWDGVIFSMAPGTSCLAILSPWDKEGNGGWEVV